MAWTCPDCRRSFGAKGRRHQCEPGLSVTEWLAEARPEAEPILRTIEAHLTSLDGDLVIDPVPKKVLFKNGPTFAVLETKTKWTAIGFTLRRRLETGRLSRKVSEYQGRFHHVINLTDPAQVDEQLLDWLTESFHRDGPPVTVGVDPLVPDDIDDEFLGDLG